MSEKDNLQEADGTKDINTTETSDKNALTEESTTTPDTPETQDEPVEEPADNTDQEVTEASEDTVENVEEPAETSDEAEDTVSETEDAETLESKDEKVQEDKAIEEIDNSNAEDAEDDENHKRHEIEVKDYHTMDMDALVSELKVLVSNEKVQLIRKQVESIKNEFNTKFGALLEEKKQEFLDGGGNSIDFRFDFPLKKEFNALFKEYRDKRQSYFKNLEQTLKENLENRLEIIDEIKGLLNVEENINTTYKHFKALQERWRNAGPIPRDRYNNVWNNYHHHVENFYDFLHLNRDLRDLDFKHNLEQKLKIIERAEELAQDDDSNRAFRELQVLHKMWKEELGPVAKEFREEIWERFRTATKTIHDKRQLFFEELDKVYQKNLEKKHEIIAEIESISEDIASNHAAWQKKIKSVEDLRQQFFNAGKVPIKVNEATWSKFKEAVRAFNRKKNAFYKGLKKEQYENLQKKMELIKIAEENKDNEDFEATTPLMKKIQSDWKSIGHVPRKDSDKIWEQFKSACNHYFDRLHQTRNAANKDEVEAFGKENFHA